MRIDWDKVGEVYVPLFLFVAAVLVLVRVLW